MTGASPDWLDARAPHDDAARQHSLPLLDAAAEVLLAATSPGDTVTVVDLGAGTGRSALWFREHLSPRLPERHLAWHLVDGHAPSLALAAGHFPDAGQLVASLADLPAALGEHLEETTGRPAPGSLLLTCSAVLDVLRVQDVDAVLGTLARHAGIGLFLLSITEDWSLEPAAVQDGPIARAFAAHQQREDRLGAAGAQTLADRAAVRGMAVRRGSSPWELSGPVDAPFLERFLDERVEAAVEQEPELAAEAAEWLAARTDQARASETGAGLHVTVDHLDLLVDARSAR